MLAANKRPKPISLIPKQPIQSNKPMPRHFDYIEDHSGIIGPRAQLPNHLTSHLQLPRNLRHHLLLLVQALLLAVFTLHQHLQWF